MTVEGRTFTPLPMALWSKYPDSRQARYRAKHRKLLKERQMFCTDIQVLAGAPEEAFVRAWDLIVSRGSRYANDLQRTAAESEDMLVRYRVNEMVRLISEIGGIDRFDYKLSLKVLDHIEVTPEGKFAVIFLDGTRIMV